MPAELTIASLNLHCGVGSKGRPYDVEKAILGLDAQVIVLQETWLRDLEPDPVAAAAEALAAEPFREQLSEFTTLACLGLPGDMGRGRFGMAVLSALPVTGYEVAELGWARGDVVPRRAQIVTIELPAGQALRLAAAHLTHRLVSPGQLWRLIRTLDAAPLPTVIAGDLNMPRLVAGAAPGHAAVLQGRTWPAEMPVLQLDHVLVSREIELVEGAVLPPAGSDHLPIRAHVRLRHAPRRG